MSHVDLILDNARLRDEIEPFLDESVFCVDTNQMTIEMENDYLSSLLAWERAPVLPISQWFDPELTLLPHYDLDDLELHQQLHQVIGRLFEKNIVLRHTDHLSDRQLYCLIVRDILPSQEKKLILPKQYFYWQCLDSTQDEESWLRFYASDDERYQWAMETGLKLPPIEPLPYPRRIPTGLINDN